VSKKREANKWLERGNEKTLLKRSFAHLLIVVPAKFVDNCDVASQVLGPFASAKKAKIARSLSKFFLITGELEGGNPREWFETRRGGERKELSLPTPDKRFRGKRPSVCSEFESLQVS